MWFAEFVVPLGNALAEQNSVHMILGNENVATTLGYPLERWLAKGVGYTTLPHIRKRRPFQIASTIITGAKAIHHFHPDIIHVQDAFDPFAAFLIPSFGLTPVIVEIHDPIPHPGDYNQQRLRFRLSSSLLRKRADAFVAHGEFCRQVIIDSDQICADIVYSVPLGTPSIFRDWADPAVVEEPHSILFFGRMREYKGLQYLVQAEPLISAQVPDLNIILAGSGPDLARCEGMMVNRDRFEVHNGYISTENMIHLFQRASIVVVPYIEASQSAVITSAFIFGKPVVATRVGGIPDVVTDGIEGSLVPPKDVDALAQVIVELLRDERKRKVMGQAALAKAEGPLSWGSIAEQMYHVYLKTLQR